MYTPHPSLVPIEMASAGMLTVTNSFENKTRRGDGRDLAEPDRGRAEPRRARGRALRGGRTRVEDFDARAQGSHVRWSRYWAESFDDELMERVESLLER